jgi:hypothetical protein
MALFNKFACFVGNVAHGMHDMQTGTTQVYKVYLSNSQPVATNTVYNAPADLPAGNGYAAGGASIGPITGAQSAGIFKLTAGTQPTWVASGGSIGPFQFALLYNSSAPTLPLIGWWDYGAPLTLTNGNTFTVTTDVLNGILTIA